MIDAAAATFSLASSRLSKNPRAALATGATSGGLWSVGAIANEIGNSPHGNWASGANFLNAAAGALSTAASVVSGKTQSGLSYASAAAWVGNGTASIAHAATDGGLNAASRTLHAASGAANMVAGVLAVAATSASATNDSERAVNLGTASSVLWGVGALAQMGAGYVAGPRNREDSPA
jgi:hypothetical protein